MAETYPKDAIPTETTVLDDDPMYEDVGAILCEIDVPTSDGALLVLQLRGFSDESGSVQVMLRRRGEQVGRLWIDAGNLPGVIDALQGIAAVWAPLGKK